MKREGEVRNIRKHPHAQSAVEYLKGLGATDILVKNKGHLHIHWTAGGKGMRITLSSTPTVPEQCANKARQMIRHAFRQNGVEIAA